METIPVVLYFGGILENGVNYRNFKVAGMLINDTCRYNELKFKVSERLKITVLNNFVMKFQVKEDMPPLDIYDDVSCSFFLEICKKTNEYARYPLIVDVQHFDPLLHLHSESAELLIGEGSHNGHTQTNAIIPLVTQTISNTYEYASMVAEHIIQCETKVNMSRKYGEWKEEDVIRDHNNTVIETGQLFVDKITMKKAMSMYSIKQNRQHKVQRSSATDYVLVCQDSENCQWKFKASVVGKSEMFRIRELNSVHTCSVHNLMGHHRQATAEIVSEYISSRVINPKKNYSPSDIMDQMMSDFSVSMSYQKAWRSKERALEKIRGSPHNYSSIPAWLYMLEKKNPGSKTDLLLETDGRFKYLFFSLGPSIAAWKHCFPIIVIDGTFLKATYRGTLLTASAQDANRCIVPLAFAVVDTETEHSWTWFFRHLRDTLGVRNGQCIVSDRQNGILNGLDTVYPDIMHGACTFHVLKNIKKHYKKSGDELKQAYNRLCRAYNIEEFNKHMAELDEIDHRIRGFLERVGLDKISRLHGSSSRYSTMTSNIAESLNNALKQVRVLPIEAMVESIRCLVQSWYYKHKEEAMWTSTLLSTNAEKKLRDNINASRKYKVESSSHVVYTVYTTTKQFIVDIVQKTCTCEEFQYQEMPCEHAAAVLNKRNLNCYDFCSEFYMKAALIRCYASAIMPLGDKDEWVVPETIKNLKVLPPNTKRPPGRPKTTRYKSVLEVKKPQRCRRCNGRGHNRKTCTNSIF